MLRNEIELANTRLKLRELEARYEERRHEPAEDPRARELTLWSLKKIINQMKEEIALYEVHQPARR